MTEFDGAEHLARSGIRGRRLTAIELFLFYQAIMHERIINFQQIKTARINDSLHNPRCPLDVQYKSRASYR